MEKEIKNFDRKIEQIMNENSVAPPFGMWNRISSELESEALPIAAAAAATFIPKRAVVGFITGVALIGVSLVTAYLVSNNSKQIETAIPIASITEPTPSVSKVIPSNDANVVLEKANHIQLAKVNKTDASKITEQQVGVANETSTDNRFGNNTDVSVPNQAIASNGTETGNYYFPPVDINTPANEPNEEIAVVGSDQLTKQDAEEKSADNKIKIFSSNSNEVRIKLKKHRKGGWGYGSLNRLNKHKAN